VIKKNFSTLGVAQKITLIFSLILAFALASYAVVFWFNTKQKTHASQIDVAGRNRMLSQRIDAMALLIDTDNEAQASTAKEEMQRAIVLMEQSLKVLKEGGIAPGIEPPITLPPAPAHLITKIEEIEHFFSGYREIASALMNESRFQESSTNSILKDSSTIDNMNPKFKYALVKLKQRLIGGTLLKMNVELTQLFAQQGGVSNNAFVLLIILMLINLAIIGFAFTLLKSTLQPLGPITAHIGTMAEGQIPPFIKIDREDEIGQMGSALNALSENMNAATTFAKNVGEGKLDTQVQVFNGKGDLSQSLYAMRSNLKKLAEEDEKRNWTTEGLAKFSDILRANVDLKTFNENVLTNVVKYTKSNQGSLFLVNDTDKNNIYLELSACYAYNRKKFLAKQIKPGEGLVGQAYLEQETIFMKDLPENYISITSGLGGANPSSLLIVPLKVNDEIIGIVEIASFQEYQSHEISFVEKLGENIASTIAGVKINERTQNLLQASQQQAEELKAQEEEMRQNMEEMTATQEEMVRKQKEYAVMAAKAQDSEAEAKMILKNLEQQNKQLREQEEMFRTYMAEAQAEFERKEAEYQARIAEIEKRSEG
jgi:nitrate/nitrite-specific signal transduction histidine kinase